MLFPQAVPGKMMSSHFTSASVSVQVINWSRMFVLRREVNRWSDYHRCFLTNSNESIPFIFMDSSVFDHLPHLSKVSSLQGRITGPASPAKGSAWLWLFCVHGQVSPWYKEVLTRDVSALRNFVAKELLSDPSKEKWWCSVYPMFHHELLQFRSGVKNKQKEIKLIEATIFPKKRMRESSEISLVLASYIHLHLFPAIVCCQWWSVLLKWIQLWSSFRLLEFSTQKHACFGQDFCVDTL